MNIKIRKATEDDFPAVMSLVKGLAQFQGTPEKVSNTVDQMIVEKSYFECFNDIRHRIQLKYPLVFFTYTVKGIYDRRDIHC